MQPQTEYNPNHIYTLACAHTQHSAENSTQTQTAQIYWTQNKSPPTTHTEHYATLEVRK